MKVKVLSIIALSMACSGLTTLAQQVSATELVDSEVKLQIESGQDPTKPSVKSIDSIDFGTIKSAMNEQTILPVGNPQIIISDAHSANFRVQVKMSQELLPGSVLHMGTPTTTIDGIMTNDISVNQENQVFLLGKSTVDGERTFAITPRLDLPSAVATGDYSTTLNWNLEIAI